MLSFGPRALRRLRAPCFGSLLLLAIVGGCSIAPSSQFESGGSGLDAATGIDGSGGSSSSSGGGFVIDADACQPGSVATYHAETYRPASGAYQGLCLPTTAGDPMSLFYDDCLGPNNNNESCANFRTANAACVACILSPETALTFGPILDHGGFVTANVAGCLELAGDEEPDASELSCAKAVQALAGCELAACEANCAVHDAASLAEYDTCSTDAEAGGCHAYATDAECAESAADANALGAACLSDFDTFYQVVVPYFCGPPPASEAGSTPHPSDASGLAQPDGASD